MVQLRIKVALRSFGLMALISLVKWLKEVQIGCSVKYLFYFLYGLQYNWNFDKANLVYIFSFDLKLVHVGVPIVSAIVGI